MAPSLQSMRPAIMIGLVLAAYGVLVLPRRSRASGRDHALRQELAGSK